MIQKFLLAVTAAGFILSCGFDLTPDTEYIYETEYISATLDGILLGGYISQGSTEIPVYWENGVSVELDENGYGGVVYAAAADAAVYSAGRVYDSSGLHQVAAFWQNETLTQLPVPAGSEESGAEDLFITEDALYIAGWYQSPDIAGAEIPCYWSASLSGLSGFTRTDLELSAPTAEIPAPQSRALAVTVIEGTVYAGGYMTGGSPGQFYPCSWSGSVSAPEPGRTVLMNYGNGQVHAVTADESGNPVFAGTWDNSASTVKPAVWFGSTLVEYFPGSDSSFADLEGALIDISFSGSELYAAGWIRDTLTGGIERPALWRDGSVENLPHGAGVEQATGILFVDGHPCISGFYSDGGAVHGCVWYEDARFYISGNAAGGAALSISSLN